MCKLALEGIIVPYIQRILAREILDSRGNPTIECDVILENGITGRVSVPSGASTGTYEAMELRDQDKDRYNGKGVLKAIHGIENEINDNLYDFPTLEQAAIDKILNDLDGTENKSNLGANALLAVSLACAKAAALSLDIPLYRYLGGLQGGQMPTPMMNILNGGVHADNPLDIQEFMIIPSYDQNFKEVLRKSTEVFHTLKGILKSKGLNTNVGDEGGFAPNIGSTKKALDLIVEAIEKAGFKPGLDFTLALDCAASEFYRDGKYHLKGENLSLTAKDLCAFYETLISEYPITSIEDGFAEEDWDGWSLFTSLLTNKIQIVGDDLFVTNAKRLQKGFNLKAANAILIKPNQIGTLTETIETINLAKKFGYNTVISHRSGETEDTTISHLAVGLNADYIKTGSLCRTDRICKYNELLRIQGDLHG